MSLYIYTSVFVLFFIILLGYLKLAARLQISDHPNYRSSHTRVTIRGGGVIFPLALLVHALYFGLDAPWFLLGLMLISAISFMDDITPQKNKIRILIHLISVLLLFMELDLFGRIGYPIVFCGILAIGVINAVNFMDGINGMTGIYSIISFATLIFINRYVIPGFTSESSLGFILIAVLTFSLFNFRKRAICFAGDVGSVSVAFILIYYIIKLIIVSGSFGYSLLLLVYGLDTASTILFRVIRKENIFEAHRTHFYQYLVNNRQFPHLIVAGIYGVSQMVINVALIYANINTLFYTVLSAFISGVLFIVLRFLVEGRKRLVKST